MGQNTHMSLSVRQILLFSLGFASFLKNQMKLSLFSEPFAAIFFAIITSKVKYHMCSLSHELWLLIEHSGK